MEEPIGFRVRTCTDWVHTGQGQVVIQGDVFLGPWQARLYRTRQTWFHKVGYLGR